MVNVVMYDILWTKSRRLRGVYTVFFLHSGPLGTLSTVSSVNIYKNTNRWLQEKYQHINRVIRSRTKP